MRAFTRNRTGVFEKAPEIVTAGFLTAMRDNPLQFALVILVWVLAMACFPTMLKLQLQNLLVAQLLVVNSAA